jgi:hypothetical protein
MRPSADLAAFGEEVVDRHRPHLLRHPRRFVGADRLNRPQVMHARRVQTSLDHGRHLADPFVEAPGEGARLVIHVPVEGIRDNQTLGRLDAQRVGVGDLLQQRDPPRLGGGFGHTGLGSCEDYSYGSLVR